MVEFWLYWFPFLLSILSLLFCKLFLYKENYDNNKNKWIKRNYNLKIWQYILFFVWAFIPLLNMMCWSIVIIALLEDHYEIKESIKEWFNNNKLVNFLNKEI